MAPEQASGHPVDRRADIWAFGVVLWEMLAGSRLFAAESISAVSMAAKNKMDLSIGIALGSSIQIALFIAPALVLMSLFVGPAQMNLNFPRALIVALFLAVIQAAMVAGDGRSNWYKGVQLIIVYLIMFPTGIAFMAALVRRGPQQDIEAEGVESGLAKRPFENAARTALDS